MQRPAAVVLTVVFVAWCYGLLWHLMAAALMVAAVVLAARWWEARTERLRAIAARADQQHAWALAGDPRGTYGQW
jgi:hypothetical protein